MRKINNTTPYLIYVVQGQLLENFDILEYLFIEADDSSHCCCHTYFVALSSSARWVRSALLSFCTVHLILSSAAVDLSHQHRDKSSGKPIIEPMAAGCNVRTLSIVLCGPLISPPPHSGSCLPGQVVLFVVGHEVFVIAERSEYDQGQNRQNTWNKISV